MGVSYHYYVGPALRCRVSYKPTTMTACANKSCSSYGRGGGGGKFCNMCAQPYGAVPSKYQQEAVDYYAVVDEVLHSQKIEDDRVFMPNVSRKAPREMSFTISDEVMTPIVADQIVAEKEWFRVAFGAEIEKLRAAYGIENVHLEWMILSWCS